MNKINFNHKAIWITAILTQGLPPLWYSEIFFQEPWMALNNFKNEDFANFDMATGMTVAFVSTVALGYALAFIFSRMNVASALEGLKYASFFWVSFILIEIGTQNFFTLRPIELTLIDEGVLLLKYEIFGMVLGAWQR